MSNQQSQSTEGNYNSAFGLGWRR